MCFSLQETRVLVQLEHIGIPDSDSDSLYAALVQVLDSFDVESRDSLGPRRKHSGLRKTSRRSAYTRLEGSNRNAALVKPASPVGARYFRALSSSHTRTRVCSQMVSATDTNTMGDANQHQNLDHGETSFFSKAWQSD